MALGFLNLFDDSMFDQNLDVLDVGCGLGLQADWWASRRPKHEADRYGMKEFTECHAVDLYEPDAGLKDKFYFRKEDFHKMSFDDNQFDIVWSHLSLEYSPKPLEALKEWRRVCKDDGHIYITVPGSFKKKFGRIHTEMKPGQQSWFTVPILMQQLAYAGFNPRNGYFQADFKNGLIRALVPANPDSVGFDPLVTSMYELAENGLFNDWVNGMIAERGTFDESKLVIQWVTGDVLDYRSL